MIPTRRDLHFELQPQSVRNWHVRGPYVTHFANALSITFPDGERYFIHTVRHYREQIRDPELQAALTAFIGQEAMHAREHEAYNRLLSKAGLPAAELERLFASFAERLKNWLPPAAQLSITVAQEHFTAIFAELVLSDPRVLEGASARLSAFWRWHALEETEHKAVAFDVFETVMGRGLKAYALRSGSMLATTAGFLLLTLYFQQRLLSADPGARSGRGLRDFLDFMLVTPGLLRRLGLPWLSYFRFGFHPWQHDNHHLLAQMDTVVEETRRPALQAA